MEVLYRDDRIELLKSDAEDEKTKNLTLRLPVDLHARLVPLAKKNHRSMHGQIIAMLEDAAEREEKKK